MIVGYAERPIIQRRKNRMKRLTFGLMVLALVTFAAVRVTAQKGKSFTGEITDFKCADFGSHTNMISTSQGTDKPIKDAKECTMICAKRGLKYVLQNNADKTAYILDDQTKPAQFAGQKVTVMGTLDT